MFIFPSSSKPLVAKRSLGVIFLFFNGVITSSIVLSQALAYSSKE